MPKHAAWRERQLCEWAARFDRTLSEWVNVNYSGGNIFQSRG